MTFRFNYTIENTEKEKCIHYLYPKKKCLNLTRVFFFLFKKIIFNYLFQFLKLNTYFSDHSFFKIEFDNEDRQMTDIDSKKSKHMTQVDLNSC